MGILLYLNRFIQPSAEEFDRARDLVDKHYRSGLYYGQSASSTVYILATLLERVDNDFLWYMHPIAIVI